VALRALRRKWIVVAIAVPVVAAVAIALLYLEQRSEEAPQRYVRTEPEAPPDLAKLRDVFSSGLAALQNNDADTAVRRFSSFTFGPRVVEEYRLYYLAKAFQQSGNDAAARRALIALWNRNPRMVFGNDAGLTLAAMHSGAGAPRQAADVCAAVASRTDNPNLAAAARWQEVAQRVVIGDLAGAVHAAKQIALTSPRSPQAGDAIAFLRAVWSLAPNQALHLTPEERLERAVCLMRDGDPGNAIDELNAVDPVAPPSIKEPIALNRGIALFETRHFDDAAKTLEPLTHSAYRFAVPALYFASKSYRVLSNSIDPTVYKTVTQKKKVPVKVRVGKGKTARTVTRSRIATTKHAVKLLDLARQAKKDAYDRLATERLRDLLQLPIAMPIRVEVLNNLIALAEAKNQDDVEQQLVKEVVGVDPTSDSGLQHFWGKAWAAYERGDLNAAKELFRFIHDTYSYPNVKRQSEYWYARSIDRLGEKEEAAAIYQRIASAPYLDLYATFAVRHGAVHQENHTNPLNKTGLDWGDIAEKEMPSELRLAYELTALLDMQDARAEVQKNIRPANNRYAQAILADYYNATGDLDLMYRAAKQAFPQLATVEEDSAPAYFLRMYYPVRYVDAIRKYSARNGVDTHLVMGLIHQESYYNPRAKSPVGATGLMQLMPSTARELSQRLHIPFGASRLTTPDVNIELGTLQLKLLMNMFNGNPYLVIASYNAGQGNVLKWKRGSAGKAPDEFIESIPFQETRTYVKHVVMLQSAYARIAP